MIFIGKSNEYGFLKKVRKYLELIVGQGRVFTILGELLYDSGDFFTEDKGFIS
jgi:hypothetical protein